MPRVFITVCSLDALCDSSFKLLDRWLLPDRLSYVRAKASLTLLAVVRCSEHICSVKNGQMPQFPQQVPCFRFYLVTGGRGPLWLWSLLPAMGWLLTSFRTVGPQLHCPAHSHPSFTCHGLCRRDDALSAWEGRQGQMRGLATLPCLISSWEGLVF